MMSATHLNVDNIDTKLDTACASTTCGEPQPSPRTEVFTPTTNAKLYDNHREEDCTTLMVRNIPNKYSQRMVLGVIEKYGFKGTFNFLYVPSDFSTRVNVGYCFVNFTTPAFAQQFARVFHRMHLSGFKSKKLVQISLGTTQGFDSNIKKFEDSTLCSEFVAPEFHPLIFDPISGEEIPFRSLMPGYEKPPKSRIEDPEYWAKEDEVNHQKKWEGGAIYPTVVDERLKVGGNVNYVNQNKNSPERSQQQQPQQQMQMQQQQNQLRTNQNLQTLPEGAISRIVTGQSRFTAEMSPHSRALHASRYSHRAASIGGAPPGLAHPRYERHHGHGGYPLPTAELYEIYQGMGPNYTIPPRARRASVAAGPAPGLTSDFTEFVTRLEENYHPGRLYGSTFQSPNGLQGREPSPPGWEQQQQRQRRLSNEVARW